MNFVYASEAQQALKKISELQKSRMRCFGKKIYIGHEKREGWRGELPFYLFWCPACEHFAKDYPHGHIERQYLNCAYCGVCHDFVPWWVHWRELWNTIKFVYKYRS